MSQDIKAQSTDSSRKILLNSMLTDLQELLRLTEETIQTLSNKKLGEETVPDFFSQTLSDIEQYNQNLKLSVTGLGEYFSLAELQEHQDLFNRVQAVDIFLQEIVPGLTVDPDVKTVKLFSDYVQDPSSHLGPSSSPNSNPGSSSGLDLNSSLSSSRADLSLSSHLGSNSSPSSRSSSNPASSSSSSSDNVKDVYRVVEDLKKKYSFLPKAFLQKEWARKLLANFNGDFNALRQRDTLSGKTHCVSQPARILDVLCKELIANITRKIIFPGEEIYMAHSNRVYLPTDKYGAPLSVSLKSPVTKKDVEETSKARDLLTNTDFIKTIKTKSEELILKKSILAELPKLYIEYKLGQIAQEEKIKRTRLQDRTPKAKTGGMLTQGPTEEKANVKTLVKNLTYDHNIITNRLKELIKYIDQIMSQMLHHPHSNSMAKVFKILTKRLENLKDVNIFDDISKDKEATRVLQSFYTTYIQLAEKLSHSKEKVLSQGLPIAISTNEPVDFLAFARSQLDRLRGNKEMEIPRPPESPVLDGSFNSQPSSPLSVSVSSFTSSDETPDSPTGLDSSTVSSSISSSNKISSGISGSDDSKKAVLLPFSPPQRSSAQSFKIPVNLTFLAPPTLAGSKGTTSSLNELSEASLSGSSPSLGSLTEG